MKIKILVLILICTVSFFINCNDPKFQSTEVSFSEIGKGVLAGNGKERIFKSQDEANTLADKFINEINKESKNLEEYRKASNIKYNIF